MRSYRKRYANNGELINRFTAGQTDKNSLSFGYGGQACPGRYFAVAEIKLVLMRLLLEFDFKLEEGKTRPKIMQYVYYNYLFAFMNLDTLTLHPPTFHLYSAITSN